MNADRAGVTAAAEAIRHRELRQQRITMAVVPALGVLMALSAAAAALSVSPSAFGIAIMTLSGIFYLMSYSCLISSQWTIGMIPQAGIGAYFFILSALLPTVTSCEHEWVKAVFGLVSAAAGIPVAFILCVLTVMLFGSFSPSDRGEYTLLVLGCKLKDGKPGRMLRRRVQKAAHEMKKDPCRMCVLSGGRAPDQPCAEAEAMADYLVELGVDKGRIIKESLSSTTYENFLFSGKLLENNKLPRRVGVVTDRFHQFRSGRIARSAGMESFPVSCSTVWYLAVQFWMRDVLCIAERLIKGHW